MASVVDRPFSGDLSYHNCDTLLFEKDTGRPCGLISHTCSNYCSWPRPVIRGNLANVPRVRYRYSCTTKALQFACILGSCLHNLCVQSLRLVETSSPSPSATFYFESFRSVTHTQNDLWVRHPNTHWTHNVLSTAWVLQRTPPPTRPLLDYDVNPLRSGGAVEVIKACTLWQWSERTMVVQHWDWDTRLWGSVWAAEIKRLTSRPWCSQQ